MPLCRSDILSGFFKLFADNLNLEMVQFPILHSNNRLSGDRVLILCIARNAFSG